jgi:Reverse transcriptase (RNA-dependent DNA polymerase)
VIASTHTGTLPLPGLPPSVVGAHAFSDLQHNLVGVSPLTQAGCSVLFEKEQATITFPDATTTPIVCPATANGLWTVPIPQGATGKPIEGPAAIALYASELVRSQTTAPFIAMAALGNSNHPADLVTYQHGALYSPSLSTIIRALEKKRLPFLPGLTKELLRKYQPDLEATTMGHLDARRKNIQSTKNEWTQVKSKKKKKADTGTPEYPDMEAALAEEIADTDPVQDETRSHHCYLAISEPRNLVYSDQTGRFPIPSSTGNNYLMIAYDYDSNMILLRPMKDRSAASLTAAIASVHDTLSKGGCRPQFHRLDNECPQQVKDYFSKRDVKFQLAPPGEHRTNIAERAIRTAKGHLKAGWWSMDKEFPMHLWDKTIPQAEITLNLLRGSRINPNLSAWEQIMGRFDFNATPLAPPGVRVLAHARASQRGTWATNAFQGWYVGPAMDHYRCFQVWATKTRQTRIVNQVVWFPTKAFPRLTSVELLRATVEDLQVILTNPPTETFVGSMEQTQRGQLINLHEILHQTVEALDLSKPGAHKPDAARLGVPHKAPTNAETHTPSLGVVDTDTPRRSNRSTQRPVRYQAHEAVTTSMAISPSEFVGMAINPDTGRLTEYRKLATSSIGPRWHLAFSKEWGRLFQGYRCPTDPTHTVQGTSTCQLIHPSEIPNGKKATYIRIVADYREHKADPYRVRCTVGGNLIDFPGDTSTRGADLLTVKCLFNNVVSTPGARAACIDIKDFYLNNILPHAEFVRFRREDIPQDIWTQYNLDHYVTADDYIYARVDKGMYGLPQAGKVASDFLIPRLKAAGYIETGTTPGLFKHQTNSIIFALVVDDFFVQYTDLEDFEHLAATLKEDYEITTDMEATKFCGITLAWDYEEGHVTLSMPGYVAKALHRFTHPDPSRPQHAPHPWTTPNYGASVQYAEPEDTSPPLDKHGTKRLQEVIGTFLFYGRAVDNTMLTALGTIASSQSSGTERTMDTLMQLLDYAATHPDAAIRFHKSDMILYGHSDASYLSEPKARSRVGGYFYLGNDNEAPDLTKPNGPIHIESRIMKNVMAAASEAEIGALFHNGQEAAHMRNVLREMGREQTKPTRLTTDNSTADGFANKRTKIRRSKAMDMRFYWIQDRVEQKQFHIHWLQGESNHGDYFTKHHSPAHHMKMRPIYLHTGNLATSSTPDSRGVLILSPGSLSSQECDSWRASALASHRAGREGLFEPSHNSLTFPPPVASS